MSHQPPRDTRGACIHETSIAGAATCRHLAEPIEWGVRYYRWLTGKSLEVELLCSTCADRRASGETVEIVSICEQCRVKLESDLGDLEGMRGLPEIRLRPTSIDTRVTETPLPWRFEEVIDFAPLQGTRGSWIFLRRPGMVGRVDTDSGATSDVCALELPPAESSDDVYQGHALTPKLHLSTGGDFAAVVHDYGKTGAVYDLRTGALTMRLHGGDYHPETVPFSLALVQHRGRTLVVHRTAWNRLDASDAATGELLTARGPTRFGRGEPRPEHYLDYFHGRLIVSPDERRIVDDGWVWHPVGIPATWDLHAWLGSNVWESEDGETKLDLDVRDYYWDRAMCWLDAERIALGGIGNDSDKMIDGVRIFSVDPSARTQHGFARELDAFAGPAGTLFSDGRWLFSSDQTGLCVWDLADGARTGRIDMFKPTRQHVGGRELAELSGKTLRRWRY